MLPYLSEINKFGQFWFVTITPYEKDIEQNVPDKEDVIKSFKCLSESVGINSVCWRYDPIFISEKYSIERHLNDFEFIAKELSGYTKNCVISFIDLYEKVKRNFPEIQTVNYNDRIFLGKQLIKIASKYGITIKPCAEGNELEEFGADCSGCMTLETFEKAINCHLDIPLSVKPNSRKECACYLTSDIGEYNTCSHFCRYCYANYNKKSVQENVAKHNPLSPLLIGNILPNDKIHNATQKSWKSQQGRLEF